MFPTPSPTLPTILTLRSLLSHLTPPSPVASHRVPISISFHEVRHRRPASLAGIALHFASLSSLSLIVRSVLLPGPTASPWAWRTGSSQSARVWLSGAASRIQPEGGARTLSAQVPVSGMGCSARQPGARASGSPRRPLSSRLAHADEAVRLHHPGFRLRHRRAPAPTPASGSRLLEPQDHARPRGGSAREGRRERTLSGLPRGPGMRRGRFGGKHGAGRTMTMSVA